MKNKIAKAIRVTAIILIILGAIGSFVLAATAIDVLGKTEFSFSILLQSLMVTALGGLLLIGFSEVIELINTIKGNTEKAGEDIQTILVHTIAMYKANEEKPDLCKKCGTPLPKGSRACPNCNHWN